MSDEHAKNDDDIFKVETIPPPEGESDAYNAATKVGPMADSVLKEMVHAAERKAAELSQRAVTWQQLAARCDHCQRGVQ